MMKLIALYFVTALFLMNASSADAGMKMQLCGRRLSEALSLVCDGQYFEPQGNAIEKRSLKQIFPDSHSVSSWIMQRGSFRLTRGIVDECCREGCSHDTLSAYCG